LKVDAPLLIVLAQRAFTVSVVRYVAIIVPVFLVTYVIFGRALRSRRIQGRDVVPAHMAREFGLSIASCAVFAVVDIVVTVLSLWGVMHLRVFAPPPALPAFVGETLLLLVFHDAYFYWAHRFMHWGPMFRLTHAMHHRSVAPTPFATYGFHPLEAFIQYGFVPVVALVMPVSLLPLFAVGIVMTVMNAVGHLGIEIFPRTLMRHRLGRYILTPTHHDLHHSTVQYNFGFYTNVWDRLMGTNHPNYEREFERAASGERPSAREVLPAAQSAGA
jgi:sterol desaturase/sphingolipid hydroxylase (fatty acid hydroxylase superfamily)